MNKKINIQEVLLAWLDEESKEGIILYDVNYRVIYMNIWFESYFSFKIDDVIGKSLWEIFPEINDLRHRRYLESATKGQVSVLSNRFHKYFIPILLNENEFNSLNYMQQQVTISPLSISGLIKGGKIVISDVTERVYQELKLKNQINELEKIEQNLTENQKVLSEINEELKNTMAEKERFFSIIAHDLIGPFSSFLGLTDILSTDLDTLSHEEIQNLAKLMNKSANNLFDLLKNLLDWSRIKRGKLVFAPVVLNLLDSLNETVDIMLSSFKNKGVDIKIDVDKNHSIMADYNMLQTILRNLISNALKFTPKGGLVTVSANRDPLNETIISISDTGIGMNQEQIDGLFKIDVDSSRPGTNGEPSTGLGLQLCKEYLEIHKGRIWVESEEYKGSIFNFTIPN